MKLKSILTGFTVLAVVSTVSFAENSCLSDTDISPKQAKEVLKPVIGNAKIISISDSPIDGLYEIIININGRKIPIYLDCSLQYLITGEIIDINAKKSLTRETIAKLNEQDLKEKLANLEKVLGKQKVQKLKEAIGDKGISRINIVNLDNIPFEGRVIYGNKNAKSTIYVITDPECPFCKRLHDQLKKVLKNRDDIKFEMIMFPLPFHKHAKALASAVVCQHNNEKSKEVLDDAFKNQSDKEKLTKITKKACSSGDKIIEKHQKFAKTVGVKGTPTLVFDIGQGKALTISGAIPAEEIENIIDALK